MDIASLIDYNFLKPTTLITDVENCCSEANIYGFRAICIPPLFVKRAKEILNGSSVKVATVIGFPFGYSAIEAKLAETVLAIVDGADEIEMLINIAALKNADWQYLAKEINTIIPIVKSKGLMMKVILETGVLTVKEIITCCDIYGAAGVDVVKTSTGFAAKSATLETVKLLRKHLADAVQINAAGKIDHRDLAMQFLDAGANYLSPEHSFQIVGDSAMLK